MPSVPRRSVSGVLLPRHGTLDRGQFDQPPTFEFSAVRSTMRHACCPCSHPEWVTCTLRRWSSTLTLTARKQPIAAQMENDDAMDPRPTVMARRGKRRGGPLADIPQPTKSWHAVRMSHLVTCCSGDLPRLVLPLFFELVLALYVQLVDPPCVAIGDLDPYPCR